MMIRLQNILLSLHSSLLSLAMLFCCVFIFACIEQNPPPHININQNPLRLQVNLSFRIGSCGFDASEYKTSCLKALVLIVRGENGQQQSCTPIQSPKNNRELVSKGFSDVALATFPSAGKVKVELHGIHNKGLAEDFNLEEICSLSEDKSHWLLWGQSQTIDLDTLSKENTDSINIDIPIECRDCSGGCTNYGEGNCPLNPQSYCVPGQKDLTCDKICTSDANCYNNQLTCDLESKRCLKSSAKVGEFCSSCSSNSDCNTEQGYFCVGRIQADEGICAHACLDSAFDNYCSSGTSCRRIGKDIWPVPLN